MGPMGPMGLQGPAGPEGPRGPSGLGYRNVTAFAGWTGIVGVGAPSSVNSVTAHFPANGVAFVVASGYCGGPLNADVRLALESVEGDFNYPWGGTAILHFTGPNAVGFDAFNLTRSFPVMQGSNTFYLNGFMYGGASGTQTFNCSSSLTVFFTEQELPESGS